MKYKKYSYILVLILMLVVGITPIYAKSTGIFGTEGDKTKDCYYMSADGNFKTRMSLHWKLKIDYSEWYDYFRNFDAWENLTSSGFTKVTIDKVGEDNYINDAEHVSNWIEDLEDNCIKGKSVCFDTIYSSNWIWPTNYINSHWKADNTEPSCPKYVVYQDTTFRWVWVTNSQSEASKAEKDIRAQGVTGYYGTLTTVDEYWKDEIAAGIIEIDNGEVTCADYETIFGNPNDDGETFDPDGDGQSSIRYMINLVLQYVRIIVPILVILLGTLDFAKAVMAGKEDNMRKAQQDFIKRVLMGVAVFFVPLLVDLIMDLADIVWNGSYPNCGL